MSNSSSEIATSGGRGVIFAGFTSSEVRGNISLRDFVSVTLQLAAILLVIWQFQIEASYGLLELVPLIFFGFVVHSLVSIDYRLPGFLILSLTAIILVLGVQHGLIVIAAGMCLIGICHLPIPFALRVLILLCIMVVCALLRAEIVSTPLSTLGTVVVPVLAAMFMFRLAIYMYNLRHDKNPGTIWESMSYFFLLPNVIFLLFPVIDYKTFRRTYYDKPAHDIYQKGLLWMMRGVVHLLLYRTVYYYFTISPSDVSDLGSAIHFMVSTYMLYLHISGQFHLIIGILCLFGFNLPETHHLFYLASGFSDYWRRINIYWKDFMMSLFYYPVLMRARVLGMTTGIVIATLVVFIGTWILHSYQWFWLRGDVLITATDSTFWAILWALVALNSIIEVKFRRKKISLQAANWSVLDALFYSLKVIGMLVVMTVLWTLWNSHTFGDFFRVLQAATSDSALNWGIFALCLACLAAAGVLVQYLNFKGYSFVEVGNSPSSKRAALNTGITAAALIVLAGGFPFYLNFGSGVSSYVASLSTERLNKTDSDSMEAGYYEGLLNMGGYTSALARVQGRKPNDWVVLRESDLIRWRDDTLEYELAPDSSDIIAMAEYQTNSWGMRDKNYSLEKPAGTYRVALLGASYNQGTGIRSDEVYESIVEQRLNDELPIEGYDKIEILNFSLGGYSLLHQVSLVDKKIERFSPDIAILTVHTTEHNRLRIHLQGLINQGNSIDYPEVEAAVHATGVTSEMRHDEQIEALSPLTAQLEAWSLAEIASRLKAIGVRPVALYVPSTLEYEGTHTDRLELLRKLTQEAGFEFLELENPFLTDDIASLRLAEWDTHPNAAGHRRIADRLYDLILERPDVLLNTKDSEPEIHEPGNKPL